MKSIVRLFVDWRLWTRGSRAVTATGNTKRIACLANSRKRRGRCIAGKEILEDGRIGGWIRPVSDREDEEVSEYERRYEDGGDPRVLDVIDVPVVEPRPKGYQRENWLLDPSHRWERVRRVALNDLSQFTDSPGPLWTNGFSTRHGRNDRVPGDNRLDSSLRLIRVDGLELSVSSPSADFGDFTRRVQGRFRYGGTDYWLRVTDPEYEQRYLQEPNGTYSIGERFVTVSLGEPYQGYAYKLIAAVI